MLLAAAARGSMYTPRRELVKEAFPVIVVLAFAYGLAGIYKIAAPPAGQIIPLLLSSGSSGGTRCASHRFIRSIAPPKPRTASGRLPLPHTATTAATILQQTGGFLGP